MLHPLFLFWNVNLAWKLLREEFPAGRQLLGGLKDQPSGKLFLSCSKKGEIDLKLKILGLLAVVLFAGSTGANAALVSWSIAGSFLFLGGSQAPSFPIQPPAPYSLVLQFDDAAALITPGCGGTGTVCRYDNPTMLWSDFTSGPFIGQTIAFDTAFVEVYNDADPGLGLGLFDGYSFGGRRTNGGTELDKFTIFFLSSSDIVSGPGIPDAPPALDANMFARTRYCRGAGNSESCEEIFLSGPVTSAAVVPEPATLALLGLGLAGLGLSRPKKQ